MIDILDLAFITDKSIDKVFESGTGSFSVGGASTATHSIAHSDGKPAFFNVYWSVDNLMWFPAGHIDNQTFGPLSSTTVYAYCTSTNIVFYASTNGGGSRTVYVKYELFFAEQ